MISEIQQTQSQPSAVYRHTNCCGNFVKILPENYRKPCFTVGIILLLNGAISLITGIVGFFTTSQYIYYHSNYAYYYHNQTVFTGANIWAGIFYALAGIFGIASYKNQNNPHLMNSFFSFSIIGLILSLPHIGISVGFLANWGYGIQYTVTLWFNVVSIIISVLGFICTLVAIILLGNNIYCKTTAATTVTTVHYQTAPGQVMAFQQYPAPAGQYPNQPVMAFQPAPVYTQSPQMAQTTINQTETEVSATGKTQLPPVYAKLPNVGQEEQKNPFN